MKYENLYKLIGNTEKELYINEWIFLSFNEALEGMKIMLKMDKKM